MCYIYIYYILQFFIYIYVLKVSIKTHVHHILFPFPVLETGECEVAVLGRIVQLQCRDGQFDQTVGTCQDQC